MMKVKRGEQASKGPRKRSEAHAAVRSIKRQIVQQRKQGIEVLRDNKYDARKLR